MKQQKYFKCSFVHTIYLHNGVAFGMFPVINYLCLSIIHSEQVYAAVGNELGLRGVFVQVIAGPHSALWLLY